MTHLPPVVVSAARFEYRWATLTELNAVDISAETIRLAVIAHPARAPIAGDLIAPAVLQHPTASSVKAAVWVDATYPAGEYDLWIGTADTPELPMRRAGSFTTI